MYLYKRTYIGNKYKDTDKQAKIEAKGVKQERVSEIIEEMAYWRKANAVHQWFVDNVQSGEDDNNGQHYVTQDKLRELLGTVTTVLDASKLVEGKVHNGTQYTPELGKQEIIEDGKVIADPTVAKKLLPTQSGFFFGSTDYDEYYYNDLVDTKKQVEAILAEGDTGEIYYHASW